MTAAGWPAGFVGWRTGVALVLVVAAAASAMLVPRLEVDNGLERWVGSDDEATRRYRQFRDTFGSDEFVLVAVDGRPLFDDDVLDAMVTCATELEAISGVRRVQGIPVVFRDLFGGEDVDELEAEMTSTPFYTDLFVSASRDVAGIVVEVAPTGGAGDRRRLVAAVRQATETLVEAGLDVSVVGSTALIVALDELSAGETARTLPVALACSLLVLALVLRSLRAMAVAAACSGLSVLLVGGLVVVSGRSLNMITSVLPALLWVLALSNIVHILQRFRRHRVDADAGGALASALAETTWPCVLAATTTAVGFASLLVASMQPVRELGVFAAAGILLSLSVNLTVGPVLILVLKVPARRPSSAGREGASRPALAVRRPWPMVVVALAVAGAAVASLPLIRVESNPLSFLPSVHPTVTAYAKVGERLTGFYTMEVVVETAQEWWHPSAWPVLEGLQSELSASPIVARVLTPLDLLRKLNQWRHGFDPDHYRLPGTGAEAEDLLAGLDEEGHELLAGLAAPSGRQVRLSAVVNEMDEGRFLDLVRSTKQAVAGLPAGFQGFVTGQVLQLVDAQQALVSTQLRSLSVALAVVFAFIGVGLRSLRYMVVSLLPNSLPVLAAFGVMAMTRIPLDAATVMMASVALGIAVDNTLHLLAAYDRLRRQGRSVQAAASAAVSRVSAAATVTTATACAGFGALCLSAFLPVRYFGLLAAVAMVVALAADLVVVPALLVVADRKSGDRVAVDVG